MITSTNDKLLKMQQRAPADISTYTEWLCGKEDGDDKAFSQSYWYGSKNN
jgi:hypothetical protein